MSGQHLNQDASTGVGVGVGADGVEGLLQQHQQMQDRATILSVSGTDRQFVMLRTSMRNKILKYIGRKRSSAEWQRRFPVLAEWLEEILYKNFPNKNDYCNMMKGPFAPQLLFAVRTLSTEIHQNQQNRTRQTISSYSTTTTLRKILDLLVHVSTCRSGSCQYPSCQKVKGLFHHGMHCKTNASGGCVLCKKMWYMLQLHARACKQSDCRVPRCRDLKEHLIRLQQQSDSRRNDAAKSNGSLAEFVQNDFRSMMDAQFQVQLRTLVVCCSCWLWREPRSLGVSGKDGVLCSGSLAH